MNFDLNGLDINNSDWDCLLLNSWIDETRNNVFNSIFSHVLATDNRRYLASNLDWLRSRDWLLNDIISNDNLLYEWDN